MAEDFWWKKAGIFYAFARKSHFVKNVHNAFLERIDELHLQPGTRALDAGCGDGNITFPLAKRGFDVVAIDFGEAVLKRAKIKQDKLQIKNIIFEFADLNNPLKYPDDSFVLITSLHVIMKIKNYQTALSEFYRVLKPGGYLVISTTSSNETFSHWFLRYIKKNGIIKSFWDIRWIIAWGIPYCLLTRRKERRDEWRWKKEELQKHLEDSGFMTLLVQDVPYIHVGCALGVFKKL
ncbi:MAG: class I SAM-dependent methyltransferase [Candidatus Hydrogenedentota bacterium]